MMQALTDLKKCVARKFSSYNENDFQFVSFLREPVHRFVSEFIHVRHTGSVWVFEMEPLSEQQTIFKEHMKNCVGFNKTNWARVSFDEFISCRSNLAINRQVKYLAKHSLDIAYRSDARLLKEAKEGLESLSFYGIFEYQTESRLLFEKMFGERLKFCGRNHISRNNYFEKVPNSKERTHWFVKNSLSPALITKIIVINDLDIKLYEFALELFFRRLQFFRIAFKN